MSNPKIQVGADMSAVNSELQKLEETARRVSKALSSGEVGIDLSQAKKDLASLDALSKAVVSNLTGMKDASAGPSSADLKKLKEVLEMAADAGGDLSKVLAAVGQSSGFNNTIRGSKAVADNLERARKAQDILSREGIKLSNTQARAATASFNDWRSSGSRGTGKLRNMEFDDWLDGGWRKHSIHQGESEANRRKILQSVGIPVGGGADGWKQRFSGRGAGAVAGAVGGMAGAALSGGDGMFSAMGNMGGGLLGSGAGALVAGPAGALVGGIVGTVASSVLGAFGGMLDQALQRVVADAADMTDLRHSLGATSVDFEDLRANVREFSDGLRLSYNEATKLARAFSGAAGVDMAASDVAKGMQTGAGFSRSYGIDPSAGVQFFGSMRHMRATTGDAQDKRVALMIGEAVARNGVTPQMTEVLRTVQSFVETSTRSSLTQANVSGYTNFLSGMMGLGFAGSKDVNGAAAAMSSADSALRQGGAFGEASKAFSLGVYQRAMPGFSVFDMDVIKDQGAFGSASRAFGKDSPAYQMAMARGDTGTAKRYARFAREGGSESIMSMQMRGLEQMSGGDTDAFRKSIMSHFGVNAAQASALYMANKNPGGLGGLQRMLEGAGVSMESIMPQQIGELAQVAGLSAGDLRVRAGKLKGDKSLGADEVAMLEKAMGKEGTTEELRKVVLKLTAAHDTARDQGEILDQQQKDIQRLTDDVVTKLVPAVSAMKGYVLDILKAIAPDTSLDFAGVESSGAGSIALTGQRAKDRAATIARAQELGWSEEKTAVILGQIQKESGFNRNAVSSVGAFGLGQFMPATARGLGFNNRSFEGFLEKGLPYMGKNYDRFGARGSYYAHNAGPGAVNPDGTLKNPEIADANGRTADHAEDAMRYGRAYLESGMAGPRPSPGRRAAGAGLALLTPGTVGNLASSYSAQWIQQMLGGGADPAPPPISAGAGVGNRPGMQAYSFDHNITLTDPYGIPITNSIVNTHIGPPVPLGVGR